MWPRIKAINELRYSKIRKQGVKHPLHSLVRLQLTGRFKRSFQPQVTDEIFEVIDVNNNFKAPIYKLKSIMKNDEEPLIGMLIFPLVAQCDSSVT